MGKIEELTLKGQGLFSFPGERRLDYRKIVKLPDAAFAALYLELMEEYRNRDGWWGEDKIPHCSECGQVIPSPRELRRYYGRSLHPACFREVLEREGDDTGIMKRYWRRVASLDLSPNYNKQPPQNI